MIYVMSSQRFSARFCLRLLTLSISVRVITQPERPSQQKPSKLGLQLDPKPSPLTDDRCIRSPEAVPRSSALSLSSEFLPRHGTDRRDAAIGLRECCGDPKLSRLDGGRDFKTVLVLI